MQLKKNYNSELSLSTLQSVVEERGCYYFKGLIRIQKEQKVLILYGEGTDRKNMLRLGQNATDRNRT